MKPSNSNEQHNELLKVDEVSSYLKGLFKSYENLDQLHNEEDVASTINFLQEVLKKWYIGSERKKVVSNSLSHEERNDYFFSEDMPNEGSQYLEILDFFKDKILPSSVHTWNPYCLGYMFSGPPMLATVSEMLANMLSPTLATQEMSPAASLIEKSVVKWVMRLIGMPKASAGIFLPGGSFSNRMGLLIARNKFLNAHGKQKGIFGCPRGVIICSEKSHYSIDTAANILGIGTEQVIKVKSNERGEMLISDLVDKLNQCEKEKVVPFAVVATLGITTTGGCDPLPKIVEICRKRNIHVHLDAAFGSVMAFSSRREGYFKGIEHVDTVTLDLHKGGVLGASLSCSLLMARSKELLKENFSNDADYLFHDPSSRDEDLGLYSPLCAKPFDSLKVWIMWKTMGTQYLECMANKRLELSQWFYEKLLEDDEFEPAYEPVNPILCFRYVPYQLKGESDAKLDAFQIKVRQELLEKCGIMINYTTLNQRTYLRCVLTQPTTKKKTIDDILRAIKKVTFNSLNQG